MSSLDNLQGMVDLMAGRAHELTGATGDAVPMCDGDTLRQRAGSGIERDRAGLRVNRKGSVVGMVEDLGRSLRSDDAQTNARERARARRDGVHSMLRLHCASTARSSASRR